MFSPSMVARIAVLASADRDFVPVAEFLQNEGLKVVHGCFEVDPGNRTKR